MQSNTNAAAPTKSTAEGRKQIIDKMTACVMSDRNRAYGDPEDNFGNIAALWNAYLKGQGVAAVKLAATDVAVMSALIKVARLATNPTHVDSWVDLAGYAVCGGGIVASKEGWSDCTGVAANEVIAAGTVWRHVQTRELMVVVSVEPDVVAYRSVYSNGPGETRQLMRNEFLQLHIPDNPPERPAKLPVGPAKFPENAGEASK